MFNEGDLVIFNGKVYEVFHVHSSDSLWSGRVGIYISEDSPNEEDLYVSESELQLVFTK